MIVIDTHIWLWWAYKPEKLSSQQRDALHAHRASEIGVCSISCWEVAWLAEHRRIELGVPTSEWINDGLKFPGVKWLAMTPDIAIKAVQLPEPFPPDPSDRFIAATAIVHGCTLLTADKKIQKFTGVQTLA